MRTTGYGRCCPRWRGPSSGGPTTRCASSYRLRNCLFWADARLRQFIDSHDWISRYLLPAYAPDLNPVEGVWSLLRRSHQASTAFTDPDHLLSALRQGLRQIQYRSNLIDGCLKETDLTLTTSRQQGQ
ncbi:hypothetical protein SGRIM119S_03195 [Streptomyces griseorubiginosus]